ncbi:MAG: Holliday junction resolvase RuvX [Pseudomonadota bacterium]
MSSEGCFLGFDFGERKIGVAVGHALTSTANPLVTLKAEHGQPDWGVVADLIQEWKPRALVVGLPLQMDGTRQEVTRLAQKFANRLRGRFGLPVHTMDERLSSAEAADFIKNEREKGNRGKTRRGDEDRIAAALILQHWLETRNADG